MARDTRAAFLRALAQVEPAIARAFEAAVMDVRSTAQARLIDEAMRRGIESGDVGRAFGEVTAALQLGEEFFAPLDRSIDAAFEAGAIYQLSTLPEKPLGHTAPRLVVRFQGRHPRAEAWTRNRAANLIAELTDDARVVIRETIAEAVEQGRPYRSVTRALIGRTQGNQRVGGLIGLHSRQAEAVRRARSELEALDSAYFRRERRDRRFDGLIRRAMREERGLTATEIERISGRYADRLLQSRGRAIARTEGNAAMNAGRNESIEQMIENGRVRADLVTKIWDATPGPRTRDSHRALNGATVGWREGFVSPMTGAVLARPHDPNAPASETTNCRCSMRVRIDWSAMAL